MHKKKVNQKIAYYAKILIFISIALFIYGLILDIDNEYKLFSPSKEVIVLNEEESTISITTSDGSEIIPGNTIVKTKDPENESTTPKEPEIDNTITPDNQQVQNNAIKDSPSSEEPTPSLDEINNNLRNEIQNLFGITVRYGKETNGYEVAGVTTTSIEDQNTVNEQLTKLKKTLEMYPKGLFTEIKNGGIPLTIILIKSYSEPTITGVTDSSYSYANISIASEHPFEESFFHESYHFIERYLFKRGATFNNWDSLNPEGFTYNSHSTGNNELSYNHTYSQTAPFVNNYAQTAGAEDRASTFEYMMSSSKASCLNYGTIVWQKADNMAQTIRLILSSVQAIPKGQVTWEQYLY